MSVFDPANPDPRILAQIDRLQNRYIRVLSKRDIHGWAACFSEGSSYLCVTRETADENLPLALMYDDNFARIQDRVNYITQVWVDTFEDYTMRHIVHRMEVEQSGPDRYKVESNIMVAYTTARGRSELLTSGVYEDEIELGANPRFISKKVIIDTAVTPRYIVYPI